MEEAWRFRLLRSAADPLELDVVELEAAIELVALGVATRVFVAGLRRPEAVAGIGAARAQRTGVAFALDRDPRTGALTARVGPRI